MKNTFLFFTIAFLSGCFDLFDKNEKLLNEYRINDSSIIQVYYVGLGATTKDNIQIKRKDLQEITLLKTIEGFNDSYKINLSSINDTLFKITFTDTAYFKGKSRDFYFTSNKKNDL